MAKKGPPPDSVCRKPVFVAECGKLGYQDKTAAKVALRNVRSARRHQAQHGQRAFGKAGERRSYHCTRCGLWHLTSMPTELSTAEGRRIRGLAGESAGP